MDCGWGWGWGGVEVKFGFRLWGDSGGGEVGCWVGGSVGRERGGRAIPSGGTG